MRRLVLLDLLTLSATRSRLARADQGDSAASMRRPAKRQHRIQRLGRGVG